MQAAGKYRSQGRAKENLALSKYGSRPDSDVETIGSGTKPPHLVNTSNSKIAILCIIYLYKKD